MAGLTYAQQALYWRPENNNNRQFLLFATLFVFLVMLLAGFISHINLPPADRTARVKVPERIANFILQKEGVEKKPVKKIQPVIKPAPKPEVKKEKKPKVKKNNKPKTKQKLSDKEQQAREKAARSGLLALGNELADLMDTDDVSAMVGVDITSTDSDPAGKTGSISQQSQALLFNDATKGSQGIDLTRYESTATTPIKNTRLSQRTISKVKQTLVSSDIQNKALNLNKTQKVKKSDKSRTTGIRSEEGITIVFDQNKSKLYRIYNRARRTNPGLKGKIVLEITILPSGQVSHIKIVSNELNDDKLEKSLLKRIKLFKFGSQNVEEITVTYPIEFLPA